MAFSSVLDEGDVYVRATKILSADLSCRWLVSTSVYVGRRAAAAPLEPAARLMMRRQVQKADRQYNQALTARNEGGEMLLKSGGRCKEVVIEFALVAARVPYQQPLPKDFDFSESCFIY